MIRITVNSAAEKSWFYKFCRQYVYVTNPRRYTGTYWFGITEDFLEWCTLRNAGSMPASMALRHPDFYAAYTRFCLTGRWRSYSIPRNEITPLPLPG